MIEEEVVKGHFKLKYTRIKASQINVYYHPFHKYSWPKDLLVQYIRRYRNYSIVYITLTTLEKIKS